MALGYGLVAILTALACGLFTAQFGFWLGLTVALAAGMTSPVLLVAFRLARSSHAGHHPELEKAARTDTLPAGQ